MAAPKEYLERMCRKEKYIKVLLSLGLGNLTPEVCEEIKKQLLSKNLGTVPFFVFDDDNSLMY